MSPWALWSNMAAWTRKPSGHRGPRVWELGFRIGALTSIYSRQIVWHPAKRPELSHMAALAVDREFVYIEPYRAPGPYIGLYREGPIGPHGATTKNHTYGRPSGAPFGANLRIPLFSDSWKKQLALSGFIVKRAFTSPMRYD